MEEKIIINGTFKGSRPPNRGDLNKNRVSIEESITKIKFKRTIGRILKLIGANS